MKYDRKKWIERIRNRTDISSYLFHLTKAHGGKGAMQNLIQIITDKTINGSTNAGFIAGKDSATCFQEVPLYSLCQNTYHEQIFRKELGGKIRYNAIGLGFAKPYVYSKGGRPVIYERLETAKKFIDEDEWWRIVSFDLSDEDKIVDWTHEREWRVKGNFDFKLSEAYVLLTHSEQYKRFIKDVSHDVIKGLGGIVVLDPVLT